MSGEFGNQVNPDPFSPLPIIPKKAEPRCTIVCSSDLRNCPANDPNFKNPKVPYMSVAGESCAMICTSEPGLENAPEPNIPEPEKEKGPRTASRGDWQRLIGLMRR